MMALIPWFFCSAAHAQNAPPDRSLEKQFDSHLSSADIKARLERLSARPHHVGSPYDKENAEFILSQYKTWGFDARIEEFSTLFPTPKTRLLEMISPVKYTAVLKEPPLKEDRTSDEVAEQLATYNAYSIDGDVTADLIYVNYGVLSDYDELERMGIDVRGKIVITRYGGSWRGIKPKVAAEHGAIGCLIYSDPKDDGFYAGDVYPKGAWRNEFGVQRGSVADMPVYPGDPSTPFVGATPGVKHLPVKEIKVLTKIPVLPISYHDALPLLQSLTGPVAPDHWKGALPVTYHVGPGPATVHLKLEFNWDIKPIYDVIAMIRGSLYPDQWIIRGNHHDGWVNGAEDPLSGQAATMEEGKALGELTKTGWRPKRTIVYCAWDGEEPGLIGSTEWVETHAAELRQKAVAYINSDSNGRGFVGMEGSPTLQHFINDVARDVLDPEKNISVRITCSPALISALTLFSPKSRIHNEGEGEDFEKERSMTKRAFVIVAAGLIAVVNPAFSNILMVPSEFRGRMLTGVGTGLPAVMNVRIVVDSYTTQDEVALLQDFVNKNDSEGFFSAFNQIKKGSLQFPGEMGLNISFHAAFETPTDKGMKIILAGESQALPAGFSPSAEAWKVLAPGKNRSGLFLFLVAELDLDKNFKGEGKVYEEARITFTPEGGIKLDSYVKTPKMIVNIEKMK